jgi:hypothetical protein
MAYRVEGDYAITTFPDGTELVADLREQPGQSEIADHIGCTVAEMNATHDQFHSLLAATLGLRCSPSLFAASKKEPSSLLSGLEEDAVLAMQRFYFAACREGWK